MNKKFTFIATLMTILLFSSLIYAEESSNEKYTSSYTSIAEKDCITLDSDDIGSIQECESFGDIRVKVLEGDMRQSITLIRQNVEYNLDFQSTTSTDFSTLGSKIEWRHEKGKPKNLKGIIVRFEVYDDLDDLDKVHTYLVVSKITPHAICIVGKIPPQSNQNELARAMLDSNEELPCLKETNPLSDVP